MAERMPDRKRLLDTAAEAVLNQRNKSYGEPDEDFARIARTLNALGYRGPENRDLRGHDVSVIMISLKLSRLTWMETHEDSWVDIAGYAACGMETANLQAARDADVKPMLASVEVSAAKNSFCSVECENGHTYVGMCALRLPANRSAG